MTFGNFFIHTQAPLPPSCRYLQHARKCVPPSTRRSVEPTTLPTVRIWSPDCDKTMPLGKSFQTTASRILMSLFKSSIHRFLRQEYIINYMCTFPNVRIESLILLNLVMCLNEQNNQAYWLIVSRDFLSDPFQVFNWKLFKMKVTVPFHSRHNLMTTVWR